MRWTVIRGDSLQKVPWRNGHGTSRNIVTRLGRDGVLLWQVGLAELVHDAPFSHYPHCDRIFTPVEGDPPVELSFNEGPFEPCPLLVPRHFAGEWPVRCRVRAPGRAFNAVADRRHFGIDVQVLHLAAGDPVIPPDTPDVIIHCLDGELAGSARVLEGDSLMGAGPASPGAAAKPSVLLVVAIRPGAARPSGG